MRRFFSLLPLFAVSTLLAQVAAPEAVDWSNLPRVKSYGTYRTSSNNFYVDSNDDSKRIIPGETLVMADLRGPGVVTHIWVTVADNEYAWPRLLRLRAYYDGRKTPSVDVPLGDFFGVGHGYERNLNSLMVRNSSFGRARNSYWPMPFRKSCRMTVTNEGNRRVTSFYYHVDWQKHVSLSPDIGYFHAYYRQDAPPPPGKNYEFLNIRGTGHYVGTVLNIVQAQVGWFGEGDELFYVDGERAPRIEGTGSEDYFNDAWALRVSEGPWVGIPVAEGEGVGARLTGYRWHVPDPIPFRKSLRFEIEHKGWTYNADGTVRSGFEERPDFFSSVSFWYQQGVNEGLSEPPYGAARLPHGHARQIEVENLVQEATTEKGTASVEKEVFWSKDLLFFKAEGAGAKLNLPIDIAKDGRYELVAMIAQSPDYGDYVSTLDGKLTNGKTLTWASFDVPPPEAEIIRNYQEETYVALDHRLGWFDLTRGRHTLIFTCVGKDKLSSGYNLGIDAVVLAEVRSLEFKPAPRIGGGGVQALAGGGTPVYRGYTLAHYLTELKRAVVEVRPELLRAIGSFGEDAAPAVSELTANLSTPDPAVASAAAWALGQVGPKAAAAVPALAEVIKSGDPRTQGLAVLALRGMGPSARGAIDALIEALSHSDVGVRATAAATLGTMGPSAQAAVEPLAARLQTPTEDVQVMRAAAVALGQIGPDAKAALPALREKLKHVRVIYAAQEAILKIEGKPAPTWH